MQWLVRKSLLITLTLYETLWGIFNLSYSFHKMLNSEQVNLFYILTKWTFHVRICALIFVIRDNVLAEYTRTRVDESRRRTLIFDVSSFWTCFEIRFFFWLFLSVNSYFIHLPTWLSFNVRYLTLSTNSDHETNLTILINQIFSLKIQKIPINFSKIWKSRIIFVVFSHWSIRFACIIIFTSLAVVGYARSCFV